jgi:hypothetical protein
MINKISICAFIVIAGLANSALNAANAPFKQKELLPSPHILEQLKTNEAKKPRVSRSRRSSKGPKKLSAIEEFQQLAAQRHPEKWQGKENHAQAATVEQKTSKPKIVRTFDPKKIVREQTEDQRERQKREGNRVWGRYNVLNNAPLNTRRGEILRLQLGLPIFNRRERQID